MYVNRKFGMKLYVLHVAVAAAVHVVDAAVIGDDSKSRCARFTVLRPSKKVIHVFDKNVHCARYWKQPQPLSNAEFDLFARTKTCRSISGKASAEMMCCFAATCKRYVSRNAYKQI